ncbi:putative GNAT family acetyltransferase [Bradyrhizobium sp. USDA 4011]
MKQPGFCDGCRPRTTRPRGDTETPRALRGRGIASELVKGALELIRADGHKVIAGCSFVVDYLDKHPEYADLAG